MKRIKYVLTFFVLMFIFCLNVFADAANFEPYMEMYSDITENQIRITLGFAGEDLMTIKHIVTYDPKMLTLADVEEMDNFIVTISGEEENDNYRSFTLLADSDYSFTETYYAVLVFDVNPAFKNGKSSDLFFYDFTASGPEKTRYRYKGYISTLNRKSASEMNYVLKLIEDNTKTKYWLIEHYYIFVIAGILVAVIVFIIFLIPSRRKLEKRDESVGQNTKAENYDPNASNVKIDPKAIENIGKVEKEIDMSEAIIVNEDIKPFGDIVGKFEDDNEVEVLNDISNETINVFENRDPNQFAPVEESTDANTEPQAETPAQAQVEVEDTNTTFATIDGVDAFNIAPDANVPELASISPQPLDSVEMPKLNEANISTPVNNQPTEVLETLDDNTNNANNNSNAVIQSILIFLMLTATFMASPSVLADDYKIDDLRSHIVNNKKYDENLDYNGDGVVDILDIIETKDLSNCSFENLLSSDPGFAEIHGQSNNVPKNTTARANGNSNRKTTTKKASSGGSSGGSSSGSKTTTKKVSSGNNTTSRTTTSKKPSSTYGATTATTKTTKSTTTRSTTTKTTTTAKPTYQVHLLATNGSLSENDFTLQVGKTKTITLTPISGYVVNQTASSCKNISYSFSSSTRLVLSNPTSDNAICTIVFGPVSNVKVSLTYYTGKGNSTGSTPTVSTYSSKTVDNGGNGTYNSIWSVGITLPTGYKVKEAPTCGTYGNNTFSISVPAKSTTCKLYFDPILYDFAVYVAGQSAQINLGSYGKIYYGEKKKIEFSAKTLYSTVTCSDNSAPKLYKTGSNPYNYYFTYEHKTAGYPVCFVN